MLIASLRCSGIGLPEFQTRSCRLGALNEESTIVHDLKLIVEKSDGITKARADGSIKVFSKLYLDATFIAILHPLQVLPILQPQDLSST